VFYYITQQLHNNVVVVIKTPEQCDVSVAFLHNLNSGSGFAAAPLPLKEKIQSLG
jgi:hypothetical protein